uniref:Uncharacterized protein n=1 Tax=Arundo donax TaxID=35708 RepID=A0A0A9H7Y9_ARUDO
MKVDVRFLWLFFSSSSSLSMFYHYGAFLLFGPLSLICVHPEWEITLQALHVVQLARGLHNHKKPPHQKGPQLHSICNFILVRVHGTPGPPRSCGIPTALCILPSQLDLKIHHCSTP